MSREKLKKSNSKKRLMITKTILVVLFSVFAAVAVSTDISFAADKGSMDVVLVIDSSGSMKKTDPMSLRIPAAKLFISLLDKDDRAAVVSFSGTSFPIINLTPVDNEPNKIKLFEAAEKITSDGLLTNLHDALSTGLEILAKDKGTERSKIIILMSDGMMDVGNPEEDNRLVDQSKTNLAVALKDSGVKVYTIAFTDKSDIKLLEKISKRTGGFHNLAITDSEFHLIFTSIFESLKTPEMLPMSSNGFLVDKSVEEVTIVATKDAPDIKIQIDSPEGQSHTYKDKGTGIKWFVSNSFDMITVKQPAEGRWEILFSAGENNKAYVISDLKLQSDFDQMYATFGKPVDIKMWLEREGTAIKEKEILDRIDLYIEMSTPDGKTLKLKPHTNGNGIFNKKIASFTAGNYKLKIIAKGMTFERQKTFVFNVASAKEAKEEIKFKETEKKIREAMRSEDNKHHEDDEHQAVKEVNETDDTSWVSFFVRFFIFNLIIGICCFLYFRRKNLKNINLKDMLSPGKLLSLIKRKKTEEDPEEQESGAAPEQVEPQQEETEDKTQESQVELEIKAEPEQAEAEQEEPQQETAEEAVQESQEEQEMEIALDEIESGEETAEEAVQEGQEEQKMEIALDEIESGEETAEEAAQENQEEQKNEIALDEIESGEETAEEAAQENQEEQKNEIALDEIESGEETAEAAAQEGQEEQKAKQHRNRSNRSRK
jgi:hypothetical protein